MLRPSDTRVCTCMCMQAVSAHALMHVASPCQHCWVSLLITAPQLKSLNKHHLIYSSGAAAAAAVVTMYMPSFSWPESPLDIGRCSSRSWACVLVAHLTVLNCSFEDFSCAAGIVCAACRTSTNDEGSTVISGFHELSCYHCHAMPVPI